jgi:cytochrome P450
MNPNTATLSELSQLDITSREFKTRAHEYYARLRQDAPVFAVTLKRLHFRQRAWLITRYDDVLEVLKADTTFVKNAKNAMSPEQLRQSPQIPAMFAKLQQSLLDVDGADHDRLKVLVHKAFTPRMIEAMRQNTQTITNIALEKALKRGEIDLLHDFALPVPLAIIGQIMGVPEKDHTKFAGWTRALVSTSNGNPLFAMPSILMFVNYLRGMIAKRRKQPTDDLTSALVAAQEGSDALSTDEIVSMLILLLSAGHETTVNLIGTGVFELLRHPAQLELLRQDPSFIKPAVEELLRFVTPAETATERYAARDIEIAGVTIPKGELVVACIASANRDPSQFEHPDTLDITRANNKHLSFGQGMHYCLGAPLARLEGQIAIGTLLAGAPNLRLKDKPDDYKWRPGFVLRGLEKVPVLL